MTTRKCFRLYGISLAAIVVLACGACASFDGSSPSIDVGLHLKGTQYFCVYEVSLKINEGNRLHDRDIPYMCTSQTPRQDGSYRQSSSVDAALPKEQLRTLEVGYRRSPDGDRLVAKFSVDGKLQAIAGYRPFSIRPRFSEQGVELVRTDMLFNRQNLHSRTADTVVDYKGDN